MQLNASITKKRRARPLRYYSRPLPGPARGQEPEPGGVLPQVQQQVPGLLGAPGAVGVRGHAQGMHMASADLEDEEHLHAAQSDRAVDVEEVAREHGRGLGAQELLPRGAAALRRRRNPQPFQHPAHRAGADADAQAE